MTGSALRSDNGRRPHARLAFALAAALWACAATALAADDGMIVIPGRGESAETALANANAAGTGRPAGNPNPGGMPATNAVEAAGANPAANPAANPPAIAGGMPAGAPAYAPRAAAALPPATVPAAPAARPQAPLPAPARLATPMPAGNPNAAYGAARPAPPAAADQGRIATVVAGEPAAAMRPALAPRQPAWRANTAAAAPAVRTLPAAGASAAAAAAAAASPPGQQDPDTIRRTALAFLQQQIAGLPGKPAASVAPSFPRGLAACTTLEPFLPTGARLWGRTTVGVRCAGERPWTVYLQAKVTVQATYYAAARQIAPGEVLTAADLVARDGDLTLLPLAVITDPSQAVGSTALARVAAGLPLRQDMLKSAASVSAGQTVRVVAAGPGFTISTEGSALANAAPGQSVRVRMAAGQIVTAIVKDAGTVEIPL
ncbi:flagellar basal body P-ring formation chaperone FlgA [Burkholderia ubonensis]|uniref:flagellar basal body P-ring formation chaperone FlgA n=1 Tax=Burkholderia ubonensis TaxID=101571 RepID=UPI00075A114A|nr:flagellar basal body P-ring formation chaperone FlgA [Burkholderia ubonensis]KVG76273.1 flagellar biosynthesis protein FlgA [Burkholderia ubonensis]KVH20061.1 flagellar biosynthesis protein FlgA [Burkholderia ubonensis]KVH47815.1 flagellar biosynthesis protein FlgA [Burkholderia ubonensis]KVH83179.1 flagellar biosynthesis protein FlgA [Burkholderia ubonensis]KVM39488.1 flagellar biosynthesis protein FlgA [Burkholderia ubonensis]